MFRLVLFLLLITSSVLLNGQTSVLLSDTSHLALNDTFKIQEVEIISPVSKKYQVGSKVQTFTPMQKKSIEQGSLAELISRYAPVYIKSNAGGLSSFQFRGTNSNHTSVLIGGLDINSLTLGSSNTSQIPIYLFDEIDLMFGSSSASNGSGSIGGSVRLSLTNNWTNGFNGEVKSSIGSFDENIIGAKVFAGNGKLESVSRLSYYKKKNNFTFDNPDLFSYEKEVNTRDTQENAAIENIHFLQEINYKINNHENITSFIWISDNWHEIQPPMRGDNVKIQSNYIQSTNIRTWAKYNGHFKKFNTSFGAGFVHDDQVQNDTKNQQISTKRFITEGELNKKLDKIKYTFGFKYKHIVGDVYSYPENTRENRTDLFASIMYPFKTIINFTLNLRQQFVTNYKSAFTPALGFDLKIFSEEYSSMRLLGNVQQSYRIPTLNDRYWNFGNNIGNIDIKHEDGISFETGIKYITSLNSLTLINQINVFYMDVDDWILWVPNNKGGWQAKNLLRVISRGIELSTNTTLTLHKATIRGGFNFSYNNAYRKESQYKSKSIGRQIEYSPKFLSNGFVGVKYKSTAINLNINYTGERYLSESGTALLTPYTLVNISAYQDFKIKSEHFVADIQLNNLFNQQYQNQYRYAMPEINFRCGLKYIF